MLQSRIFLAVFLCLMLASCKKNISISPPIGLISAPVVFSSDAEAIDAVMGIYYKMINNGQTLTSSGMTIFSGMSADELIPFDQAASGSYAPFQQNNLTTTNSLVSNVFWVPSFSIIYQANSILEGLKNYSGVSDSVREELIGEVEFTRAFANFYLINLFGDIPLVTSTNWQKTGLIGRTPASEVYGLILSDLLDAQAKLLPDYSAGNGQRIVPNKWAATALLARVYLYLGRWSDADREASSIIENTSLYSFTDSLNHIFLVNSSEAIWQLQQTNQAASYNATPEAALIIPLKLNSNSNPPRFFLSQQLLDSFEQGDLRKKFWIDSTTTFGKKYYFPYKYKVGPGQAKPVGGYSEYYMVLRLAEQYLIRAEARVYEDKLSDAIADINAIRSRAGLAGTNASSSIDLLTAIVHERKIEFFSEWGHRWLDLKRIGQAVNILKPIKPFWSENSLLYPIPRNEIVKDPNLTQNPGYTY
ncbi:RagB/SusD family nutrient uptake outer membrane protein [Flavitalea sp. BT771]|uniref:RagB/SusD family nutrient uptake outer membrane protein n=1 Tax=Flavitalea sp. BT771 TaxID=3063329 RepID=UPI0026E2E1D2|nr:RagB/SusD family nutrient uptake outer membrane protein [Flavitalea sp. BT771]MDO6430712.1 RagB/SusD family nutrient uptake outer membrane protein [Flavitalea sp. BT771]MDV6219148.1 RagB/SusD family nutrient uptake outer membrane protein [Flavitalea sp. BT771]